MKKRFFLIIIFILLNFISMLLSQDRQVRVVKNERRVALVIGNSSYKSSPLRNPMNDANDIASVLRQKNFRVNLLNNANKKQMINAVRSFGSEIKRGGVGLFYFAGHGMQVEGSNYLIPIGANIQAEHEVSLEAVNVNRILGYMNSAENRLNILILDACRDNPFARSFRSSLSGLAQLDAPVGTLIAYATSPGKTAADGYGRNSIYTKYLLRMIKNSNLEIGHIFRKIRSAVRKETNGKQIPWEATSLEGTFFFGKTGSYTINSSKIPINEETDIISSRPQISEKVLHLRSKYKILSHLDVKNMVRKYGFHSNIWNESKSFKNQFEKKLLNGDLVVLDHSTKLMWQQGGSSEILLFEKARKYVENLNRNGFAGYHDWRFPTLEEVASLVESPKKSSRRMNQLFSEKQFLIWTGDCYSSTSPWILTPTLLSRCYYVGKYKYAYYVRAVRSMQ